MVGCWVTGSNQQLLKWPRFIAEIPRTSRQVVFLAIKPVCSFPSGFILGSLQHLCSRPFLFDIYRFFFPLFPGRQLGNDAGFFLLLFVKKI